MIKRNRISNNRGKAETLRAKCKRGSAVRTFLLVAKKTCDFVNKPEIYLVK